MWKQCVWPHYYCVLKSNVELKSHEDGVKPYKYQFKPIDQLSMHLVMAGKWEKYKHYYYENVVLCRVKLVHNNILLCNTF